MFKDLLKKERRKLWLAADCATNAPALGPAETAPGKADGARLDYGSRNTHCDDGWTRSHEVLAIARASSGI
jgi:hypothetical protein